MLGRNWAWFAALLFAAGLILDQQPLLLASLLFFLAVGTARLWSRFCLSRLEYSRSISMPRVFFGESTFLEVKAVNRKPLPLPWVRVEDQVPSELPLKGGRVQSSAAGPVLLNIFSLGTYRGETRRFAVDCTRRGCFSFGPAVLHSSDLFGLFKCSREVDTAARLVVYPRLLPLKALRIPPDQLFGDSRVHRHLYQDPFFNLGVREYQPGDNPRQINWKATARVGSLQTKVFDYTTTLQLMLFLDTRTVQRPHYGVNRPLLELSAVAAASLAGEAIGRGYLTGLLVNEYNFDGGGLLKVMPGGRRGQLRLILEALARLRSVEKLGLGEMLLRENKRIGPGASVAAITAFPDETVTVALSRLRRSGRKVALVVIGDATAGPLPGDIPVFRVPGDLPWHRLEEVALL